MSFMRAIGTPLAFASTIWLGGCLSTAELTSDIQEAQAIAKQICGVVPTAASIGAAINAAIFGTAAAWSQAVCLAVGSPPAGVKFHTVARFGSIWTPPHPVVINGGVVNFY